MSDIKRFGVSIESDLLVSYDQLIAARSYATRSEALRDLIRDSLVQERLEMNSGTAQVVGSLTLVYDHHAHDLSSQMSAVQHEYHELVVSVLHVHISHDDCMEVIVLRGAYQQINMLANALLSLKGVKHGKLFVSLPAGMIAQRTHDADHAHRHTHATHTHNHSG